MKKLACALLCAAFRLAVGGDARAAPSEGEALFRDGRAAMQSKNFDRACALFAESQRKEPAPGTALNLGDCEEQRGHFVAARDAYAIAAATFRAADKQKYATSRLESVDKKIPRLVLRTSRRVKGLALRVAGNSVFADTDIALDPGEVTIV